MIYNFSYFLYLESCFFLHCGRTHSDIYDEVNFCSFFFVTDNVNIAVTCKKNARDLVAVIHAVFNQVFYCN
ncbi:hypothetical protein PDJAM_G00226430 [Pangasius djambal]|uniref:Uncharacterized protein n=1 Tax=Pangasius djambal TaxID=1691987 RepID=A0ACC5YE08_9TELE|nr:hypothetical protein [Pangasius djambal]